MLPLCDKDLIIRLLSRDDLKSFVAYRNDPDVNLYQSWDLPYTMDQAEEILNQQSDEDNVRPGTGLQLAVVIDDEFVGDLYCNISEDAIVAEIGFCLDRNYWGKGIIKRAATILIDYLFDQFRFLTLIRATRDPENFRSMNTLQSIGFTFDEIAPLSVNIRGQLMDDARHSLTRYQWLDHLHHRQQDPE